MAQVPGTWPDANGNPTTSYSHSSFALGTGTATPAGWHEIKYCPPPVGLDQKGLVLTRVDCNIGGNSGGIGGNSSLDGNYCESICTGNEKFSTFNILTLGSKPYAIMTLERVLRCKHFVCLVKPPLILDLKVA